MHAQTLAAGVLAVSLLASGDGARKVERDWVKHPAVVEVDTDEDMFVVGDVHSDYNRLVKLLTSAGIIRDAPAGPQAVEWSAGQSIVVFTGDMMDKGKYGLKVLLLAQALRDAASRNGGQVIVLMGNHEAEFLADPGNRKAVGFVEELRAAGLDPAEVAACQGNLGRFLCSLPFAARVRDWFFAHAGNAGGRTIERLNGDLRNAVEKNGFGTPELVGSDSLLEAPLRGKGLKPWFESRAAAGDGRRVLEKDAAALGVRHLVQGHEPGNIRFADGTLRNAGEMFQRYGVLFLVDTGMSKGVGNSTGAILHVKGKTGQEAIAICADGTETTLWNDRSRPETGKAAACGK